jgi:hypothetical protein
MRRSFCGLCVFSVNLPPRAAASYFIFVFFHLSGLTRARAPILLGSDTFTSVSDLEPAAVAIKTQHSSRIYLIQPHADHRCAPLGLVEFESMLMPTHPNANSFFIYELGLGLTGPQGNQNSLIVSIPE